MADNERVIDLLARWHELQSAGESISVEELCANCPELIEEIRQQIEALGSMQKFLDQEYVNGIAAVDAETLPPADSSNRVDGQPTGSWTGDRSSWPGVPGFEILGELGRGGMGVVYKARQMGLNRLVALKMILVGAHAGEEERRRFRTEAEAVARLQHPNIIQIHEIGEHDGLPFFSLEYVSGGSLDRRLQGIPQPPRDSAQLVEALARAMHAAHLQGIIHRDLKPANVLLQITDGCTIPKITDFGLAKQLQEPGSTATGGMTRSGSVMGTPSYMAPEQAENSKNVGPAADVYSLGAILYEMMTGRPPFKEATPVDTIMRVLLDEPVPPSRINQLLPRDLETICLKCLQKAPRHRYTSAFELAEDLRRFQAGEPIRARRVGRGEKLLRWCRRKPAIAAVLGLSVLTLALAFVLIRNSWQTERPGENIVPHVEPLRVLSFQLNQHRGDKGSLLGQVGVSAKTVRFDDDVRVNVELNQPAYCYLIAFNPDGKEQLCDPRDDKTPPEGKAALDYPADPTKYFALTDGVGLQAFVLMASRDPLPTFAEWKAKNGAAPWQALKDEGTWRFDGRRLEEIGPHRGQERKRQGPPQALQDLCSLFKDRAAALQVLAFPVLPKE